MCRAGGQGWSDLERESLRGTLTRMPHRTTNYRPIQGACEGDLHFLGVLARQR